MTETTTTASEEGVTRGHRESAVGRWSQDVPVPLAEQRQEICDGPEHAGKPFAVRTLRVFHRWNGLRWVLAGPNIRQDGSLGKYTLSRVAGRAYLEAEYPAALAVLDAALRGLQQLVRSDAEAAVAQIEAALQPAGPVA